ncbi:MAG: HEAT repeat domain-containing protein [Opitutaceae bacterium]|nr:HEAT repeat domain-containing protein [Opitutaceae bacterium]
MNCQRVRQIFPELLDSRTSATQVPSGSTGTIEEARAHLASCPDCQREFARLSQTMQALDTLPIAPPSGRLRRDFYAMLEEEKHSAESVRAAAERQYRVRRAAMWRWVLSPLAACALVAAGFFAGRKVTPMAPAPATSSPDAVALQQQIKQLQDQVSNMGTLVSYSLLQQQQRPANDRLRGVMSSATLENPSDRAINDLISAVAFDSSPNVRLRALEALYPHAEQDVVRAGVLASLGREQNPLVQVSMIDFLAAANDVEARPALEKISVSVASDENVRNAARRALTQF